MNLYFYRLKSEPTHAAQISPEIRGAFVHIWVKAASISDGEAKARACVMDYGWLVIDLEHALHPTESQIERLEVDERANCEKAKRFGISAFFIAWPKQDRTDGIVEISPLEEPIGGSKNAQ